MNFAQTTIAPQSIYPQRLTQQGINQQRADLSQQYNPLTVAKSFDRPGVSRGPQTAARMAPVMAQGFAEQAAVGPNMQFSDAAANKNMILQGQQARDSEAGQWARLLAQWQNAQQRQRMDSMGMLMDLLGRFTGG